MIPGTDLVTMTRVDVIVGAEDIPVVTELLRGQARGFTTLPHVTGFGHDGPREGRLLFNDRESLTLLLVVLPTERAGDVIAGIRAVLERRPGLLLVSETWVSRPEYFR